ncbi:YjbH domain-containing protein [Salinisphaera sp. RV14]|uniref:YjbH domain-containing protein n=1 Tax=unclassified Salinisphaera TaxID=2649847 RepID=UPI003F854E6F
MLAEDYGTTINLSNVRLRCRARQLRGVYIGRQQVPSTKHGESGFNNGIYLRLDIFCTKSSRSSVTAHYTPLARDGGASRNRQYKLYSLTGMRDLNRYWDGFKTDN